MRLTPDRRLRTAGRRPAAAREPPAFDVLIKGGTLYDGSGGPARGGPTSACAATASRRSATSAAPRGGDGHRRDGPRGRPRLRQHALVGDGRPAGRSPLARRHPAGRDDRDLRRGRVLRALERADEAPAPGDAGRLPVRHHVDDARRVPALPRAPRRRAERGLVRRHGHDPRARGGPRRRAARRPRSSRRCASSCGARWRRAPSASARRSSTPPTRSTPPEDLIELAKRRGALPGQVHHPHAQRGRPAARGGGRDDPRRARGGDPGRDLPPEGRRRGELAEARARDREGRGGAARRGCGSPPTCTRTRRAPRASTRACRPGAAREAGGRPSSASATARRERGS